MSLQTAPYNNSMRIGSGFNSYTQQLCIDNAVIKENKNSASDKDLKPKLHDAKTGDTVSQQVTFTSRFIENSSDITEAMNVSGALEIKWNGIGVNGSGAYVDSSKVKDSDINYFVQVKVVNQHLVAEDVTKFNSIANVSATDRGRFTNIYGDSFISGFLEGGEFNALLSVKVADKSKAKDIKGDLSLSLEKGGFGISGSAKGEYSATDMSQHAETSVTVSWTGGGDIHDENFKSQGWTIESMAKAAFSFADRVRVCPQRTHAILTKYTALRSYQLLTNKGTPLDYENAGVYTNALLENYMEYKTIWKEIQTMAKEVSENVKMLVERSTDSGTATAIENMKEEYVSILKEGKDPKYENVTKDSFPHIPDQLYAPTLISLEKARLHCRLQMIRIVKEVDAVAEDPQVAVDAYRVGQFLNPLIFRQLLPGIEIRPTDEELKDMRQKTAKLQEMVDTGFKDSTKKLASMEEKCNKLQKRLDATPPTAEEMTEMQKQLQDAKQELEAGSQTKGKVEELQKKLKVIGDELQKGSHMPGNVEGLQKQCDNLEQMSKALASSP